MNSNWDRYRTEIFDDHMYDIGITKDHYDVVMDIGANVGHFCEYIYDRADVIYALEPGAASYAELLKRINEKGLTKVLPFNIGIGGSKTTTLFDPESESTFWGSNMRETIELTTLRDFIQEHDIKKIDLLKIDCEGCEKDCFNPAFGSIGIPIIDIVGESHSDFDPAVIEKFGYNVRPESIFTAQKI